MAITLFRVVNENLDFVPRSILIDKADDGLPNRENYAQFRKQKVYVPFKNPADPTVKGYVDFVPTDRILMSADRGTIAGLVSSGWVSFTAFSSALVHTPVVTAAANAAGTTTINGTTFLSLSPDITKVVLTNLFGVSQLVTQAVFTLHTAIQIDIPDAAVSIGVPGVGWKLYVFANSRSSAVFSM